jgi:PAS domain S-box-containing protein
VEYSVLFRKTFTASIAQKRPLFLSAFLVIASQAVCLMATSSNLVAQENFAKLVKEKPQKLTAVVPRSWPPQYQLDNDGKPVGFAIDIMNKIAARAGLKVDYLVVDSFAAANEIIRRGDADVIPNHGILPNRDKTFLFTVPVETFVVSLFVRDNNQNINGVADLVGRKLAVVKSNIGVSLFGKRRDIGVQIVPDLKTALFNLLSGNVEAVVYPQPVLLALARQLGIQDRIKVAGPPLKEIKRGIGVAKDKVVLFDMLNKAAKIFVITPEYRQIYTKWYGKAEPFWTKPHFAWAMGILVLSALFAMAWWRQHSILKLNTSLRESEERYALAISGTNDGIWDWDIRSNADYFSPRWKEILGYGEIELVPHLDSFIGLLHPDDRDDVMEAIKMHLEERAPFDLQYRLLHKSGKFVWVHAKGQAQWDENGEPLRMAGSISDISELKSTELELHASEAQLRQAQKMEAVGQLTGGIAHEFNNLLMVIVGNLERTMDQVTDGNAHKSLSSAMRSAMRAAELTNQLLAFSRKQTLRVEHVDLNALVRGVHEMLQQTLGETVLVNIELADGIWPVSADKSLLESTILNLSINARSAMPGGGRITITTSNRAVDAQLLAKHSNIVPGDYLMLEVTDTGTGIAPEILEHVFEPFFTTKDVGEGTGLGLSMVLGFAEQSGGFVDIESQVGKGTSICVYLPRAAELVANVEADEERGTQAPSLVATILVVEDDPDVRQIVVQTLSDLGCNIIEAKDGKTAFSALARHPEIDVLFTDVVLPEGLSGPDIASEARSMMPELKIVFTSGYPDGEINDLGYDDENPWFIRKPYRRSELAELFGRVLQS